jgi:glycogen debranching enzyme
VHFAMRMPELHCGFPRRTGEPPIAYPVACLPQAWSAGAVFMLLQACLGITIDGWRGEVCIVQPELPHELDWLEVRGIALRRSLVDLVFRRSNGRVVAEASCRGDDVPVTVSL